MSPPENPKVAIKEVRLIPIKRGINAALQKW
jgi:hypothetical protein